MLNIKLPEIVDLKYVQCKYQQWRRKQLQGRFKLNSNIYIKMKLFGL